MWLLPDDTHKAGGEEIHLRVFYGHAMHPDGLAKGVRISARAITPGGESVKLKLLANKDCYKLRLVPEQEGLWAVGVENDIGPIVVTRGGLYKPGSRKEFRDAREASYYYQCAKTYFVTGHFCAACGDLFKQVDLRSLGHEIELIVSPGNYQVGDEVMVQVRYQGAPLPETMIAATWSGWHKPDWAQRFVSNGKGQVRVALSTPGNWLFYVRHVDRNRGVPGEYDVRVVSATLCLPGVGRG
jgi:uncharacterized GH25 family protein